MAAKTKDSVQIKDFPNYRVDRNGNVFNSKGQCLKHETTNKGYHRVSLCNETEKHKRKSVHRLVAEAFIPNPNNLSQVNHKNENKTDNSVSNLEWCSPSDNLRYSGVIEKASVAKFTRIRCMDTGEIYNSVKEAADSLGLHHSNIVACCNGRRHTCGGVRWKYVE